jgi:hypothetical protein
MSVTTGPLAVTHRRRSLYYASRDRKRKHPVQLFTGILQADAYSGYNELYDPSRSQGAITAALCKATVLRAGRYRCQCTARKERSGDLAVALAAVKRIDALFDIARDINGRRASARAPGTKPRPF